MIKAIFRYRFEGLRVPDPTADGGGALKDEVLFVAVQHNARSVNRKAVLFINLDIYAQFLDVRESGKRVASIFAGHGLQPLYFLSPGRLERIVGAHHDVRSGSAIVSRDVARQG